MVELLKRLFGKKSWILVATGLIGYLNIFIFINRDDKFTATYRDVFNVYGELFIRY